MKLHVIGTGSQGNCYILESETSALIIECGIALKEVKRKVSFSKIKGCIISHSHGDHSSRVLEYQKAGINIFCSKETAEELDIVSSYKTHMIEADKVVSISDFKIIGFDVVHDVRCFGYLVRTVPVHIGDNTETEGRTIFFATDTSEINRQFTGIDCYLIEANFSKKILFEKEFDGKIHPFLSERIFQSHFSLESCHEYLSDSDLSKTSIIVLLHLSDSNSDEKYFEKVIAELTGIQTIAARNKSEIYIF